MSTAAVNGAAVSNAGTSVARDNRLAISVQTHFFDSGSAAAVGRQERWTQRLFVWLAKGGRNGGELREQRLRAESAQVVQKMSRCLGWRIHESVEDTKLSTNKQHSLSYG